MKFFLKIENRYENTFEKSFAREMLKSEIKRVTILSGLFIALLILIPVARLFSPESFIKAGITPHDMAPAIILIVLAIIYEIAVRIVFKHFLKNDREPPPPARYMNTLVETSFPTVVIYIFAITFHPIEALYSPPTYGYFIFIILSALRLDFRLCIFTGFVAALEYIGLIIFFQKELSLLTHGLILSSVSFLYFKAILFFVGGLVAAIVANVIRKSFINSLKSVEERERIVDMFGKHVSPEVVNKLLEQEKEPVGEIRHVCVMFLDIRNFTHFSENRPPEAVVQYLNSLFDFMIDIINKHKGIINKFLGDGFMAVFGAPFSDGMDSKNAMSAAHEIIEELEKRNSDGSIPETRIGIGLHAGEAITGNVGSSRRKEYTIIGDTVNVASRIEQLNKEFGSLILISQTVYEAITEIRAGDSRLSNAIALRPIQIRGRKEPVQIFKIA